MIEVPVKLIKLVDARAMLGMTQHELAHRAGLSPVTVSNAENGGRIRPLKRHAILRVLNAERHNQGLKPLGIDDIEWEF